MKFTMKPTGHGIVVLVLRLCFSWGALLSANLALGAEISTTADSVNSIQINIKNENFDSKLTTVKRDGQLFSQWTESDHINHLDTGHPDIPKIHRFVVVDPKASYKIRFSTSGTRQIQNITLYPIQPDAIEGESSPKFTYNRRAYRQNKWLGAPWVTSGKPNKMGRFTVLPLTINLARFNPRERKVEYFESMQIDITATNTTRITPVDQPDLISASNLLAIEQLTLNGREVIQKLSSKKESSTFLVITSEDLLDSARQYVAARNYGGTEITFETIPSGTSSSNLKKLITRYYQSSNLEAVLLFGDEKKIPLHYSGNVPGDSYYSLVDGNDGLADILLGRIPASDESEASVILEKTSQYELSLSNTAGTRAVMMVAHRENYPGKYTANLESIRKAENPKGLEFLTQYGGERATSESVVELSNQDFSIINYRGHGSTQSWSGWGRNGRSFGLQDVNKLKNFETKLAIFFNIACSNGGIQSNSESLAERLLWSRGSNINGDDPVSNGAIAVLAATVPSMTEVNHRYNRNLFRYVQTTDKPNLGTVNLLAANQLVRDNNGRIPSNNKMYILFGDPMLNFKHD